MQEAQLFKNFWHVRLNYARYGRCEDWFPVVKGIKNLCRLGPQSMDVPPENASTGP